MTEWKPFAKSCSSNTRIRSPSSAPRFAGNRLKVRAEAARQLVAFDKPTLGAEVVRDWKMYPKEIHSELTSSLASRKEWARALLTAMKEKKIDRAVVTDGTITRIQGFKDAALNKLIEEAWGRTRSHPGQLLKQIDAVRVTLGEGPGSFAKGKVVFDNQCAKCHTFEGAGRTSPRARRGARDIEYILANVIDPNRVVGAPFLSGKSVRSTGRFFKDCSPRRTSGSSPSIGVRPTQEDCEKDIDGEVKVLESR